MGKGAIFDADGTLIDSMPIWEDAGARFLAGLGIKAEENLGDILFRMSIDEGAAYLKKAYKLDMTEEEVKKGELGVINDFYVNRVQAKDGAREFLMELSARRIPMYIATSSNREHIRRPVRGWACMNILTG